MQGCCFCSWPLNSRLPLAICDFRAIWSYRCISRNFRTWCMYLNFSVSQSFSYTLKTSCRIFHGTLSVCEVAEIYFNVSECTKFLLKLVKAETELCCKHTVNNGIEAATVRNLRTNEQAGSPFYLNFCRFRARRLPLVSKLVYLIRSYYSRGGRNHGKAMWLCHAQAQNKQNEKANKAQKPQSALRGGVAVAIRHVKTSMNSISNVCWNVQIAELGRALRAVPHASWLSPLEFRIDTSCLVHGPVVLGINTACILLILNSFAPVRFVLWQCAKLRVSWFSTCVWALWPSWLLPSLHMKSFAATRLSFFCKYSVNFVTFQADSSLMQAPSPPYHSSSLGSRLIFARTEQQYWYIKLQAELMASTIRCKCLLCLCRPLLQAWLLPSQWSLSSSSFHSELITAFQV